MKFSGETFSDRQRKFKDDDADAATPQGGDAHPGHEPAERNAVRPAAVDRMVDHDDRTGQGAEDD